MLILIRLANVFFAAFAVMSSILAMNGAYLRHPPPPDAEPFGARALIMYVIDFCWLGGAIGLFFRKRFAWAGCMLGAGASVCLWMALFFVAVRSCFFSSEGIEHLRKLPQGPFGEATFIPVLVLATALISLILATQLALLFGLWSKRRELLGNEQNA